MGWQRGYYYRARKVGGRVVREYIGTGPVATLSAQLDALTREKRRLEALDLRQAKAELAALDDTIRALLKTTTLLARATLLAAGYHQHRRGPWRKRRAQDGSADCPDADRLERRTDGG